ncbi:neuroendocrine protein 7B2 [Anoplophora glabripennis]|uniref:neuroendocrine protein 7B2 n=2 Tax=Anoplophora glabripennis TaxID=217634 RepID=UPI000875523A|nr:neuroendocrine protein 7B2 [Anoplophora glabripennis]
MKFVILLMCISGSFCYLPTGKDNFLSGIFLRDLVNRINGKGISEGDGISYLDFTDGLPLDARSLTRDLEEEQLLDYDGLAEVSLHPSIRDQEYLQHSTLWGKQFGPGGAGEGNQLMRNQGMKAKQEVKTDTTLPAYCNPPNPCPVGYTEEQGCIMDFENSASYSRRYQAVQDCMCDTEHMFDCPNPNGPMVDDPMESMDDMDFNRLLQQSLKMGQLYPHKNLVAKKYYHPNEQSKKTNPFLSGEKLPVAAKKGNNVLF